MTSSWFHALLLTLACSAALAQPTPVVAPLTTPVLAPTASVEGITEYRLANGLQVLLVPDDAKPTTTVNITYRVGSRHENYGETGMAHLLEHLLFKGTPTTRDVWAEFNKRGMRPNGSTSYDRTNYFASFAANDDTLRWYLGWQADAMVNSLIARSDLDTEMTVVRNEFESGENSPSRVLMQQTLAAMYQWHNYGKSIIGARSDIENVDIPRLQAFYRQYYQPDNATLTVAGKFDAPQVLAWVQQFFGPLPKPTRVIPATYTQEPVQDGERQVTLRRVGGTPLIYMTYHMPAGADPDFAAVEMLSIILGDTPAGRLHARLVEKQLAAQTFAGAESLAEPGQLILGASLAPGQDVEKARSEMTAAVDSLFSSPITAEELERARTMWINEWELGFTDPERVGVQLSEAIGTGDWRLFFLQRDQVRKLSLADVQRVAATWLRKDNRTVGIFVPTATPERAPLAQRVDVAALVKGYQGDAAAAQVEAFDPTPANLDARTQISNLNAGPGAPGLRIALLPKGTRGGVVHARLRLRYGTEQSLRGLGTVAGMAGALIDKGGAGMTRQQIADAFDRLQAEVGFSANDQTLTVGITTKRSRLPEVIALVGRLLRDPAYTPQSLDELQRQFLAGLERQRKEPSAVVSNHLARLGNPYPRGDLRYASTFEESEEDIKAVTPAQLRAFHRHFYSAGLGEFGAVGDMDVAAVQQALRSALGGWTQPADGPQAFARVPRPLVTVPPTRFLERTPDKANAVLLGQLALPLSDRHPDYPALLLANAIFGQGGNSRLWRRIRSAEGLSYSVGAGANFSPLDDNSIWSVSAIFAPQNLPKVEAAFNDELARSLKDGFTEAELVEARDGLLNSRRLGRSQDAAVAERLASNLYLGRTWAVTQALDDALAALSLERVNAAWRRAMVPQRLVMGWGGDFKP
jgi:zinc protease